MRANVITGGGRLDGQIGNRAGKFAEVGDYESLVGFGLTSQDRRQASGEPRAVHHAPLKKNRNPKMCFISTSIGPRFMRLTKPMRDLFAEEAQDMV